MDRYFTALIKIRKKLYFFEFTEVESKGSFAVNMKGYEIHRFTMIQKDDGWIVDSPSEQHWIKSFESELSDLIKRNLK